MEIFQILPLDIENDVPEISSWDEEFSSDPRYNSIKRFILENNTYIGIGEVINTNYEKYPIGKNERKLAFSIKDSNNKIIGFLLTLVNELKSNNPELIIQYIVLHPEYQHKGLGTKVLTNLISNSEKYFNTKISKVLTKIEIENFASRKLFENFGFNLVYTNSNFMKAYYSVLENNKEK